MEKALKKSIEGGKRNYMRKPQDWWFAETWNCYITHIETADDKIIVMVDKEDYPTISQYRWYMSSGGYAITSIKGKRIKLHHVVMGKPEKGFHVDHINRNKTDNRRSNLRFASTALSQANVGGGAIRKHGNKYEANVCLNYKKFFKSFDTEEEAKKWRDDIKHRLIDTLAEGKSPDDFFNSLLSK